MIQVAMPFAAFVLEATGAQTRTILKYNVMKQLTEGYFQQRQPQIVANSGQ